MSLFLPDNNQPKRKKEKGISGYNFVTGAPIYESRTEYRAPPRQGRQPRERPISFQENYNTVKNIGKGIHHAYKASKQHYGTRLPYDVNSTIERAKKLKAQEKKGEEYRKAQEYIMDFEGRRAEYEAQHPRSKLDKLLGRRRL